MLEKFSLASSGPYSSSASCAKRIKIWSHDRLGRCRTINLSPASLQRNTGPSFGGRTGHHLPNRTSGAERSSNQSRVSITLHACATLIPRLAWNFGIQSLVEWGVRESMITASVLVIDWEIGIKVGKRSELAMSFHQLDEDTSSSASSTESDTVLSDIPRISASSRRFPFSYVFQVSHIRPTYNTSTLIRLPFSASQSLALLTPPRIGSLYLPG